jgi:hypothetical protein
MWLCGYRVQSDDGCAQGTGLGWTQVVGCSICNVGKRFHPASQPGALCSSVPLLVRCSVRDTDTPSLESGVWSLDPCGCATLHGGLPVGAALHNDIIAH